MNIELEHKQKKYLNYNETGVLITGSKIKSDEQFEKKSSKTGWMSLSWFIPRSEIHSFTINRLNGHINILTPKEEGKFKKTSLKVEDANEGNNAADAMANIYGFEKTMNVEEPKWKIALEYAFYIGLWALFTWLLLNAATEYEATGNVDTGGGRRKSAYLILVLAAKYLGYWGSMGLAGVAGIFIVFKLIKRVKSPAQIETYSIT